MKSSAHVSKARQISVMLKINHFYIPAQGCTSLNYASRFVYTPAHNLSNQIAKELSQINPKYCVQEDGHPRILPAGHYFDLD